MPGVFTGAATGAMLTIALIALFYAGWRLAGLPFLPFDLFDWTARILPGAFIEFAIGIMVAVIGALHLGPTSVAAKEIEQAMGIFGLLITGIICGAVFFALADKARKQYAYRLGGLLGVVIGIPALLVSHSISRTAGMFAVISGAWILVLFLLWGIALGWAHAGLLVAGIPPGKEIKAGEASVERVNRRKFLIRLGGYTATITVGGAIVGVLAESYRKRGLSPTASSTRWSATHPLPNADVPVKPAPGTRPEYTPLEMHYRIDIDTTPPSIDAERWRLAIKGLVEKPLSLSLEQLRSYEPMHQFITLSCISNPVGGDLIGTTRWTGVSLRRLLSEFRLRPGATHLKIRSADGFWEVLSIDTIRSDDRLMLVYEWDGVPLLPKHGFPLRVYIPDLHGMKQPKWIESIEATDHWEPGYWVVRGWDEVARMKATSVIDTVAVDMTIIDANSQKLIPIGGIAHAGARGISKVEVQTDKGPWLEAELRTPLSDLTWVIWRYNWPFRPGKHTFAVRCFDGSATPQIVKVMPPAPSGASGLHSKSVKL